MTKRLTQKQKEVIEMELLKKEIELKFNVSRNILRHLRNKDYVKFKEIVNWLYWHKSLHISDILKTFEWSQGSITYRIISNILERRREIHNYSVDSLNYLTKCYLLGMRITDASCAKGNKGNYTFSTATSNYYGCEYFFNVFNEIKHVTLYPMIGHSEFDNTKALHVMFEVRLPARFFELDPSSKSGF